MPARGVPCFPQAKRAGYELEKELLATSTDNWFRLSDVRGPGRQRNAGRLVRPRRRRPRHGRYDTRKDLSRHAEGAQGVQAAGSIWKPNKDWRTFLPGEFRRGRAIRRSKLKRSFKPRAWSNQFQKTLRHVLTPFLARRSGGLRLFRKLKVGKFENAVITGSSAWLPSL